MQTHTSRAVHVHINSNLLPTAQSVHKMVTKSKLRLGLAAEKGTDFKKLKNQRKRKEKPGAGKPCLHQTPTTVMSQKCPAPKSWLRAKGL